ncbi:MAG: hypothetical protein WC805_03270 [Patescibacteria group bacterium]|jgi:hypothetical protein
MRVPRDKMIAVANFSVGEVMGKAASFGLDLGNHHGAYLTISAARPGDTGLFWLVDPLLVNEITNGCDEKYKGFSQSKPVFLLSRFSIYGERLSSQSSKLSGGQPPGAVVGDSDEDGEFYIFSLSGLPPICDETAMLLTAVRLGFMSMVTARELAATVFNDFFLGNQWAALDN